MVDDFILDKILHKIKEIIVIEKFDDTKILIDTDDKFLGNITLKFIVILLKCVIKDYGKFYSQIFLEEAFLNKYGIQQDGGISLY